MYGVKLISGFVFLAVIATPSSASPSAVEVLQDVYYTCVQDFSLECVKPKALHWLSEVAEDEEIRVTDNLMIVKKDNPEDKQVSLKSVIRIIVR